MKNRASRNRRSLWRIYRLPAWIAGISVLGLSSALLGDGVLDVISWLAFGLVMLAVAVAVIRRER